ncbi:HAD family hydrolase [Paenibacillus agricola]|uniref:HAD family hydrolase n=1 Tax=Paenibacillus agricola TaxID=2716264 RepID=A0ABX0JHR0_9BACL|nr:HAD family hydrolase [Paenibacillus agricola]NHN35376.1 HAD family hydrolase [Paenibacillus agricola]
MIKAVVFDFDGLIIDTETVWFECFNEVLATHGIEFPIDVFSRCIGTHGTELTDYITAKLGTLEKSQDAQALAAKLHKKKIVHVQARDGVRDYLEEAQRLGLRIGLASSSNRQWIESFLHNLELFQYFEVIKSSDDVAKVKPDPELYLQAVKALGIEPSEALAFEDSVNGSVAAKAAGMWCVIVPNPVTEHLLFENYDYRLRSMGDQSLTDVIRQLNVNNS